MRDITVLVEPGGKFYQRHPVLGYSHIAGQFRVAVRDSFAFHVTHLPNTLRVTSPAGYHLNQSAYDEIWVFGCSFTHGWGLDDKETYPWLLQERFPSHRIVNFGVGGYGTIHALLQFRNALKTKKPSVAIVAYADFHDHRNTFSRTRRKGLAPFNKLGPLVQPYALLNKNDDLEYFFADVAYPEFPLMRYLALSHYIEMKYNYMEPQWHRSREVTKALILEMRDMAKEYDVPLLIANISRGHEIQAFAEAHKIPNVNISVSSEIVRIRKNLHHPQDGHPGPAANVMYADKLENYLRAEIMK